jgi:hypothetical protein
MFVQGMNFFQNSKFSKFVITTTTMQKNKKLFHVEKMRADNVLYWIIYFIVTVLVAWIALSLIMLWIKPTLVNADGSVNWWNTLWVALLIIVFAWIIMFIITLILRLIFPPVPAGCDPCAKVEPVCDTGCHDARMWMY